MSENNTQEGDYGFFEKVGKSLYNTQYNGKPQNSEEQKSNILLDADALSAMFVVLNTMIASGYEITNENVGLFNLFSKRKTTKLAKVLRNSNFNLIHTQIIINAVINNMAIIQKIETGMGNTDAFRLIDTDKIQPVDNSQDKLGNYTLFDITDPQTKDTKRVSTDEIFIIRLYKYDNDFWGVNRFEALQNVLKSKERLQNFQDNLILTNQFRNVWNMNDDSPNFKGKMEMTKSSIKAGKLDATKEFFTAGNVTVKPLRNLSELKEVNSVLDAFNRRINAIFSVSPILAGITDGSNRSNSEIQARFAFKLSINALQQRLSEELTDMFEWLGFKKNTFIYNDYHDPKTTELVLNNFLKMQQGGIKKDKLAEYLQKNGMSIKATDIENVEPKLDKNSDLHPSRQKSDFDGTEVKSKK